MAMEGVPSLSRNEMTRLLLSGDQIVAVASSGVHSNGFSLVRRILEARGVNADTTLEPGGGSLLDAVLQPTYLYGALVRALLQGGVEVHGMAHITGGGLPENLPRTLPEGVHARIDAGSWERPALFRWLQEQGEVPEADLWNTFNLGVGFCLVLPEAAVMRIFDEINAFPGYELTIDLPRQVVVKPDGSELPFEVPPFRKQCLVNGWDDIGLTLRHADKIRAYEAERLARMPWLAQKML